MARHRKRRKRKDRKNKKKKGNILQRIKKGLQRLARFRPLMEKLVRKKGQEPERKLTKLILQVYHLYIKKKRHLELLETEASDPEVEREMLELEFLAPIVLAAIITAVGSFLVALIRQGKAQGIPDLDEYSEEELTDTEMDLQDIQEEQEETEQEKDTSTVGAQLTSDFKTPLLLGGAILAIYFISQTKKA